MAMGLREHQELTINGTHLVIGEILEVAIPLDCQHDDGSLNLIATGTVALTGLDGYHSAQLVKRMAYAKPELPPREIGRG